MAFKNRTIHVYHVEGAGGGHTPDVIRLVQEPNILPSSTTPTMSYTTNTADEHVDMVITRVVSQNPNPTSWNLLRAAPDTKLSQQKMSSTIWAPLVSCIPTLKRWEDAERLSRARGTRHIRTRLSEGHFQKTMAQELTIIERSGISVNIP